MSLMGFEEVDNTLYCQGILETIINGGENVSRAGKHLRFYFTGKANKLGCHSSWPRGSETKDFYSQQ